MFQIRVEREPRKWIDVGPPYHSKFAAQGWVRFVKAAWHGMPTRVFKVKDAEQCKKS